MKPKLKQLADQVIVITGASSGIGLVTARRAAAAGAKVLLVARSEDALREIVDDINANGGTADHFGADVGDPSALTAAAAHAVERFGRIDTWVNDAGVAIYARLEDTPEDEHQQLFRTNYFGMVHGCLAALPHLRSGGTLVTVGSVASDMSSPVMGAYAASKHALKAYVEALRIEMQDVAPGLSISLVKPAGIDTPIGQHAINHVGGEAQIPPPAYDPELVAQAILHCATHRVREITVGGAGRAQVLFATHFPALFERFAPAAAKGFVDRTKRQPRPSNLFEGAAAGRERSGEQTPLQSSPYTRAMEHPRAVAVVGIGGLALALTALALRRRA